MKIEDSTNTKRRLPAYSQNLPTLINLNEDIRVELALLQRYGIITTLPFSNYASPKICIKETIWYAETFSRLAQNQQFDFG